MAIKQEDVPDAIEKLYQRLRPAYEQHARTNAEKKAADAAYLDELIRLVLDEP